MEKRAAVHEAYNKGLADISWIDAPLPIQKDCRSSFYFYYIQLKNGKRDELARYLREAGIYTTYRYFPLHRVPHYGISGKFPGADYAADNTLCLPMHQSLTNDNVQMIIEKIAEFGKKYC